eukprot:7359094-Prymnesium_polylepis.1
MRLSLHCARARRAPCREAQSPPASVDTGHTIHNVQVGGWSRIRGSGDSCAAGRRSDARAMR